jgi:hypothetical protein
VEAFALALVFVLLTSAAIVFGTDPVINRLRDRIRSSKAANTAAVSKAPLHPQPRTQADALAE